VKFHLPSFLLGCGAGYAARSMSQHLRPVLLELATAGYRLAGTVAARAGRAREDIEDVLAEARSRARVRLQPTGVKPPVS
jgi:hypothetical protein